MVYLASTLRFDLGPTRLLAPSVWVTNGVYRSYTGFYIRKRQPMLFGTCQNKVLVPRIGLEAIVYESRIGDVCINRDFLVLG